MALQEIINEIYLQFDSENNEVLNQAKMGADKLIIDKLEELNSFYDNERITLDIELKKLEAKLKAKVDLDVFREKQKAESEMVENLLKEAYEEIAKVIKRDPDKYINFLIRHVNESIQILSTNAVSISLSKEDEKLFDRLKEAVKIELNLLPPLKIAGGVICTAGDSYIDNSIETLFNRKKPVFIKMIAEAM